MTSDIITGFIFSKSMFGVKQHICMETCNSDGKGASQPSTKKSKLKALSFALGHIFSYARNFSVIY